MSLPFKSPAVSALLNQTFVYKAIDDAKKGKLSLYINDINEADAVESVQAYLNDLADALGITGESDANAKVYSSTEIVSNGQDRKEAISALDAQAKINLDDISDLNTLIFNGAFRIKSYISDSAYESDLGSASGGEIYYNSATGFVRYFNGVESSWDDVGKQVLAVQEVPTGIIDGVNQSFDISNMPTNDEALNVFVNGLIIPKTQYSFSSPTITFNTAIATDSDIYVSYLTDGNPATPVISAGTQNVVYRTITSSEETNKELTLASAPSTPSHVFVDVVGGSTAAFGSDYTVSGSVLSWDSLNLDGLISQGDILRIQYFN